MNQTELNLHIKNTAAYIAYKPSEIILVPVERQDTPAGGYTVVDLEPRPAQTFRIIELGSNQSAPVITLTDGKQREVEFWLLGMPDAAVAVDDHWTELDGRQWRVGDVVRPNLYETRALVVERGK